MSNATTTPRELVLGIVTLHGPLPVAEIQERCATLGYKNPRSVAAVLFNLKVSKKLTKGDDGWWKTP